MSLRIALTRALPGLLLFLFALPTLAQESEATATQEMVRPVKLMTLEAGEAPLRRQFFGRVTARETVDLAFQVPGQIVRFPVTEGATLEEGALVAELDLTPFERELQRAQVNLDKAERDVGRLSELEGSAVSAVQVRDAQTQLELARIGVAEARERLEDASLTARFDSLVVKRAVPVFTTVSAGQPVVRLHDMSELRVDIEVPEVLFRRSANEASAEVAFTATFPGYAETFPLILREYEAETADVAQTFTLTLAFTGEVPDWVLPGASVTVSAEAPGQGGDAVMIPETAVIFGPDRGASVMVFNAADGGDTGTVARVAVEIEMRDDARIILTEGPEPGTEIVAAGASQLRDGQEVRRFTGLGE
ncbi:efflux RND transporter periplasmic adaptor subunit [Litorisediminicola beolgyonensis]|uniref:Efflux RND transporter periplasmic adaptor subunit n=1 Tax=Litorisediminicola beolgyonensis TaxID=1173614 RepID=A0ABW3ZNC5_9RHOB